MHKKVWGLLGYLAVHECNSSCLALIPLVERDAGEEQQQSWIAFCKRSNLNEPWFSMSPRIRAVMFSSSRPVPCWSNRRRAEKQQWHFACMCKKTLLNQITFDRNLHFPAAFRAKCRLSLNLWLGIWIELATPTRSWTGI